MQPDAASRHGLIQALGGARTLKNLIAKLQSSYVPSPEDATNLADAVKALAQNLENYLAPFKEFEATLASYPPELKASLIELAKHGWFMDFSWWAQTPIVLKNEIIAGNLDQVEISLEEIFQSRLDMIEQQICAVVPARSEIIKSAFRAHRNQEFNLSVPVFFSQIDGICKELLGDYLFTSNNGRPSVASHLEINYQDEFAKSLLAPLLESTSINLTEKKRPADFNGLNRHLVLHGESLTYGNFRNSLKAISLLNYVAHSQLSAT